MVCPPDKGGENVFDGVTGGAAESATNATTASASQNYSSPTMDLDLDPLAEDHALPSPSTTTLGKKTLPLELGKKTTAITTKMAKSGKKTPPPSLATPAAPPQKSTRSASKDAQLPVSKETLEKLFNIAAKDGLEKAFRKAFAAGWDAASQTPARAPAPAAACASVPALAYASAPAPAPAPAQTRGSLGRSS